MKTLRNIIVGIGIFSFFPLISIADCPSLDKIKCYHDDGGIINCYTGYPGWEGFPLSHDPQETKVVAFIKTEWSHDFVNNGDLTKGVVYCFYLADKGSIIRMSPGASWGTIKKPEKSSSWHKFREYWKSNQVTVTGMRCKNSNVDNCKFVYHP